MVQLVFIPYGNGRISISQYSEPLSKENGTTAIHIFFDIKLSDQCVVNLTNNEKLNELNGQFEFYRKGNDSVMGRMHYYSNDGFKGFALSSYLEDNIFDRVLDLIENGIMLKWITIETKGMQYGSGPEWDNIKNPNIYFEQVSLNFHTTELHSSIKSLDNQ